jgi:hypothetical protein
MQTIGTCSAAGFASSLHWHFFDLTGQLLDKRCHATRHHSGVMPLPAKPVSLAGMGAGFIWAGHPFKQKSRLATAFCFSLLTAHPFQTATNLV